MGMTWRVRVRGLVVAASVLGALAVASGADWTDFLSWLGLW
jgi:hypothetical protein